MDPRSRSSRRLRSETVVSEPEQSGLNFATPKPPHRSSPRRRSRHPAPGPRHSPGPRHCLPPSRRSRRSSRASRRGCSERAPRRRRFADVERRVRPCRRAEAPRPVPWCCPRDPLSLCRRLRTRSRARRQRCSGRRRSHCSSRRQRRRSRRRTGRSPHSRGHPSLLPSRAVVTTPPVPKAGSSTPGAPSAAVGSAPSATVRTFAAAPLVTARRPVRSLKAQG